LLGRKEDLVPEQQTRPGRKRDASRGDAILQAALEVLAETDYEQMTTDMVAMRAGVSKATMYRRWSSKAELVVEAVESLRDDLEVPDTGSLRGDLVALIQPAQNSSMAWKYQIMAGLLALMPRDPDLARVVQSRIVQPRIAEIRVALERAQGRQEIGADRDLDLLAFVAPAMIAHRLIAVNEPIDAAFVASIIDEVLVPASRR
jgi:AcrR family transcriptional regulator